MTGKLNLRCVYWTHNTVYLEWQKHRDMTKNPYQLSYQEGNGPIVDIHLENNYFTRSSVELPGECGDDAVTLKTGKEYTFHLEAQLEDGNVLKDSVQITLPGIWAYMYIMYFCEKRGWSLNSLR